MLHYSSVPLRRTLQGNPSRCLEPSWRVERKNTSTDRLETVSSGQERNEFRLPSSFEYQSFWDGPTIDEPRSHKRRHSDILVVWSQDLGTLFVTVSMLRSSIHGTSSFSTSLERL